MNVFAIKLRKRIKIYYTTCASDSIVIIIIIFLSNMLKQLIDDAGEI